jgi:hypothetical protein
MPPYRYSELLLRAAQRDRLPKVFHIDTSSEYWCSAAEVHVSAALGTLSDDGRTDAEMPGNVRVYLCASTQHAPAPLDAARDGRATDPPNTIDYKPFVRAAVDNLTGWVASDVAPPTSAYPRIADRTLTADLSPSVDGDGNEVPGLRHPDVAVPLATYTGWNRSVGDATVLVRGLGSTIAFDPDEVARRYPSREDFLSKIRGAADDLVGRRYLLAEDVPPILATSHQRWQRGEATGG